MNKKAEKAWEVSFTCGMVVCDSEAFLADIVPKMTKNEYIGRYNNGKA